MVYVGLDIGGTKLMAAAADSAGRILRRTRAATPRSLEAGLALLRAMTREVAGTDEIGGIGAAIGGPLDHRTGVVSPLHQPEWRDVPLAEEVRREFDCPFHVDVDTNVAAVGEYAAIGSDSSRSRPPSRLLYLTISTGMGGGFIVDGSIYRGVGGGHPEVAHQCINYRCSGSGEIACECGVPDCLEALVSGNGIARVYGKPAEKLEPAEWDEVAYNLGQGLRNIAAIYLPEEIVLGGGVAVGGGREFVAAAFDVMKSRLALVPAPIVRLSTHGYDTALMGAVHIARAGLP